MNRDMNPEQSPVSPGVRRLNKIPAVLVGILIVLVLFSLVYAVHKRSQQQQMKASEDKHSYSKPAGAKEIMAGVQDAGLINAAPAALPAPPGTTGQLRMTPSGPQQQYDEEALEELRRIKRLKKQFYETAMTASTKINVDNDVSQNINPSGPGVPFQDTLQNTDAEPGNTDPNLQQHKEAFLTKSRRSQYLPFKKEKPVSPYEIKTGAVIPGVMISGINSDLPGQIIAQVSQNVYDSATGRYLLIPQGARLYGHYDSRVTYGQKRVLIAWTRIIYPDASTLELNVMPGVDQAGYSGFKDKVNNHYIKIFGNAILLSVITAGVQLSQPDDDNNDNDNNRSLREEMAAALGQQLGQVSVEMIRRNMNIQPTLEIRPGYLFNIMVNKDIILEPWQS